jgi:hypothetical protein
MDVAITDGARRSLIALADGLVTAAARGLPLRTLVAGRDDFEYGVANWDLVVMTYVPFEIASPRFAAKIVEALRPGGVLILESIAADHDGRHRNCVHTSISGRPEPRTARSPRSPSNKRRRPPTGAFVHYRSCAWQHDEQTAGEVIRLTVSFESEAQPSSKWAEISQ